MSAIITATGLTRTYPLPRQSLFAEPGVVTGIDDLSFEVQAGERFAIVGESGSGKSTLLRIIAGLDAPTSGQITVGGIDVSRPGKHIKALRAELQMVFQDPMSSLDPHMKVRDIVAEPLVAQKIPYTADDIDKLLRDVGISSDGADRYPHQFSGGQRQRISIARALAPQPKILIADEPVSALDVSVRAQVLNLITDLVRTRDLTLVFVSHDLSVVRHLCERVAVLKDGRLVEIGPTEQVYAEPQSDYTRRLVAAIPTIGKALAGAETSDLLLGNEPEEADAQA
ncbi:ATP-binding cassette domain-containing protein [Epidermidibacterium keratini]|uniref:ATP-binding cassette domain-containing protein n=1 Tax=Epidermidibacterium keratini TaxID=1891644 RepID=A0A7L4YMM5_9ACTN|nr:ATP-binding cassette domain-containing protein [Epidermidibacterium keratini]QHC00541.1 ATP-binding cassette domain-containing protein [Epidermidibacterium keratini]